MSKSFTDVMEQLESVAAYDGPWRVLRDELPLLRERLAEVRGREARLDDLLVVALVGGSGVGKSTLLNALAGDQIAMTSEFRPCTSVPTAYHPPGAILDIGDCNCVARSALEHLVIVDTPDSDTVVREHRERVIKVLEKCDLIVICADSEKYLDEATWSLIAPLVGERSIVCVETKSRLEADSIREHWLDRLKERGVESCGYFRVGALAALDRKLLGGSASAEECEFRRFEDFLQRELTTDCIERIKRSNAVGLMRKTVERLWENVLQREPELTELDEGLVGLEKELGQEVYEILRGHLFSEPHLWNYALGREYSLRAKGLFGMMYRVLNAVQSLPARMASWIPGLGRRAAGQQAASLLADKELLAGDIGIASEEVEGRLIARLGEANLLLAKHGFDAVTPDAQMNAYLGVVNGKIADVLRGLGHARLVGQGRFLSSWFMTLVLDVPSLAFIAWTAYRIVGTYFSRTFLMGVFFVHSGSVLAILLCSELLLFSFLARGLAWNARKVAEEGLRKELSHDSGAFIAERDALAEASEMARNIRAVCDSVLL